MDQKPKILYLTTQSEQIPEDLRRSSDVEPIEDAARAFSEWSKQKFDCLCIAADSLDHFRRLQQNEHILEQMPEGVALLDVDNQIVWANRQLRDWSNGQETVGMNFYAAMGNPEILGPDFCPFHTALATGQASSSTIRTADNRYFHVHAAPVIQGELTDNMIVTVSDVTEETLQQQKLAAIHRAGIELADLTPGEVFEMEVDDRIELLKSNILHYTQDLLNFNVIEIRLLDQATGELTPLLSVGLDPDAATRDLFARPLDNGVTGFVAATGKSYLCEDITEDPLYIEGLKGALSSLTVPVIWHDHVIGTFNVESPDPRAFSESDLQFLEIFARDVAVALNTLELLVAQKANTAQQSVEAIHSAVALPVDEILNDAVNVMERYIGHEPEVVDRLKRILQNARDIKQVIQKVGQKMAPAEAVPSGVKIEKHPKLRNMRVLVVDPDEPVRNDAHALLERYGAIVETAHSGDEALMMVRNCGPNLGYEVIISDIKLPDMNGYELQCKLKELIDPVPLVLMTGFGYDPGHTIVKARREGLHPKAILYKPFRLDQLLEVVETIIDTHAKVNS